MGIINADTGSQVLQLIGGYKFRNMAGKLLAEKLNIIEQSKDKRKKFESGIAAGRRGKTGTA